jgi:hypothetical protein
MYFNTFGGAKAITPSDTVDQAFKALHVGGAGTVTVAFSDGSTAQFTAVAGQFLPVTGQRVNATGTAATLIVGYQ